LNKHINNLSPGELERIALLTEECGEVLQEIGKVLRYGYEGSHPKYGEKNSRERLQQEIADVLVIITLMIKENDININELAKCMKFKRNKINRALRYNKV